MINQLHTFEPSAILFSFGPINLYWYGLFIVLGIVAALALSFKLAKYYGLKTDLVFDLAFWLIINGLIGARLYDVLLQLPYYLQRPLAIFKVWEGGLAIHGAIIAGIITVYFFTRQKQISLWKTLALIVPGLALAQAIGRWGNYFNQELFGRPTALPWGIPINPNHRPLEYLTEGFFHPTFIYESLGCLLIFILLTALTIYFQRKKRLNEKRSVWLFALYMILYSILRLLLEFVRIDETPLFFHWRWPQVISLAIIIFGISLLIFNHHAPKKEN